MEWNKERLKNLIIAVIELILILGIIVGIPLLIYFRNPEIIEHFKSVDALDTAIAKYGRGAIPVYILCQMLQVIVTVIPGQAVQVAGGYMYGFILGLVYTLIGVTAGSFIAFGIARVLGKKPMTLIFGEEKLMRYCDMFNTKRAHIILFVLYFIPGLPKDILAYAAGISNMKTSAFIELSMAGRLLGMMVSLAIGACLRSDSYTWAIILAVTISIAFVICFVKRNALMDYIERRFEKREIK